VFEFVRREKAKHEVRRMCRLLGASPSGYYASCNRPPCPRQQEDARLRDLILAIHKRSRGNYGMPRIFDELRFDHQVRCSGKRVRRLMRQLGIKGTHRRRYRKTTERDASLAVAPDLMNRNFTATKPDEKYVGDITYIRTWEGWLYLAIILDVFSRRIVGWAMGTTLHTELVVKAFEMAVQRRRAKGTIAHSDQGCQYTSLIYGRRIREAGLVQSMGSRGDCFDNAMAESFFATLETELLDKYKFRTRETARLAVFDFIEAYYNTERRHSSLALPGLGMHSPAGFERRWFLAQGAGPVTK
jgi:putative transposase